LIAYLAVETGIPVSVLLTEPESYLDAMFSYLNWKNNPQARRAKLRSNVAVLSELDALL